MTDHYYVSADGAVHDAGPKWAVFRGQSLVCAHATEDDAKLIADLLNKKESGRRENQQLRDYLNNIRIGKGSPVTPGIERTLLIALLRRARGFLPGTAGDPSTITDEMLDPKEAGTRDAGRAQLALDIEHAYELLEIGSWL